MEFQLASACLRLPDCRIAEFHDCLIARFTGRRDKSGSFYGTPTLSHYREFRQCLYNLLVHSHVTNVLMPRLTFGDNQNVRPRIYDVLYP